MHNIIYYAKAILAQLTPIERDTFRDMKCIIDSNINNLSNMMKFYLTRHNKNQSTVVCLIFTLLTLLLFNYLLVSELQ